MKIGKYCSPFFIYTTHVPKVIIFKKNRFAAPVAWAAYERVMLYLIAFDWHIWDRSAISQIKIETSLWSPSPGFTRVNSSTAQINPSKLSSLSLAWQQNTWIKMKPVFCIKFLTHDECRLSVRLLWFKFVNVIEIISVQIANCSKGTAVALTKVLKHSV